MLKDFTLLVPVRDRHYNLKNVSTYYSDLDSKKLIVDSSTTPYDDIKFLEANGFDYVYLGPMTYVDKLHKIHTELIDTEFSVDCPDDDIVLKQSIKESVEFLRDNPEYSACDGEILWLDSTSNSLFVKHPNKFFGPLKEDFSSKDAIKRVKFDFNCCMSKQHSVVRQSVPVLTWTTLKNYPPIQPINFIERFHVFVTAIVGNSKKLPLVHSIKSQNNDRLINKPNLKNELKSNILFIDNLDDKHLKPFINLLVDNTDGLSYEDGFIFFEKLIRDQLDGPSDLCHINTDNWDFRLGWEAEKQKYDSQIAEAINAMTS